MRVVVSHKLKLKAMRCLMQVRTYFDFGFVTNEGVPLWLIKAFHQLLLFATCIYAQ